MASSVATRSSVVGEIESRWWRWRRALLSTDCGGARDLCPDSCHRAGGRPDRRGTRVHWERPSDVRLNGVRDPERVVEIHPDEAIAPPPAPTPEPSQSHRRHRLPGAAAAGLVLAFAGGLVWAHSWSSHGRTVSDVRVYANSVAVVDPATGRVVRDIRVGIGTSPSAITVGVGVVWVASTGETSVSRIYPSSTRATPIGVGGSPAAIAARPAPGKQAERLTAESMGEHGGGTAEIKLIRTGLGHRAQKSWPSVRRSSARRGPGSAFRSGLGGGG